MSVKYFLMMLPLALLTACGTMSKTECLQADWYLKGVDDASHGYAAGRVIEHGKACARVHIAPDIQDYRKGHAKGVRLYCIPEKGYSEGRSGASYNGICPVELEEKFLAAYRTGQELYVIQRNIDNLSMQLNNNQERSEANYAQISQLKYEIENSDSRDERHKKLHEIDRLRDEISALDSRYRSVERELELFKNDYRIVEDKHFRMGYIK